MTTTTTATTMNSNSAPRTAARSFDPTLPFRHVSCSVDGSKQCIGIDGLNHVYTWKLGARTRTTDTTTPAVGVAHDEFQNHDSVPVQVYAGGSDESGHVAVLTSTTSSSSGSTNSSTTKGNLLWLSGCDRWQQLGLGSSDGGASGYAWKRIWHSQFVSNVFLQSTLANNNIRDVALGSDHSVVLAENQMDVYVFGKGSEGQLGLRTKPYVSAPTKSKTLSTSDGDNRKIAAVCAIQHCSLTLNGSGKILQTSGKCRQGSKVFSAALEACIHRARQHDLLDSKEQ